MLEAALEALSIIFTWERLTWIFIGTCIGLFMGIVPGLGGMVGMALLLPFVYGMDPHAGIGLLIGMMAVVQTGDTFPAVLLGVPGTVGGQATIMDGYPMARQGKAARALGAAFSSSMLGGIVGALVLLVSLPIARPLVLAIGSPELLMFTLFGLSLVAVLSKGRPIRGIMMGLFGMLLSTVGIAGASTDVRFTFDTVYLFAGVPLVIIALAVFAIPEIVGLVVENQKIARERRTLEGGLTKGIGDTLKNWPIVLQGSGIGAAMGIIPGIGGSVVNWLTYGIAANTVRKNNHFGKGDVRGVIAPEAGNNATEGGQLVPTMLFGIPGGGTTAILLGGLVLLGIKPGPHMVDETNLPTMVSIVWTLVIANILGTALCLLFARPISGLTQIKSRYMAPFIFAVIVIAAFQTTNNWGDIVLLFVLGIVAFIAGQLDWPRIPLLIGFVLGGSAEGYFTISVSRYGFEWLTRPGVMIIGVLIIASLFLGLRRKENLVDRARTEALEVQRKKMSKKWSKKS